MGKNKLSPLEKLHHALQPAQDANPGATGLALNECTRMLRKIADRGTPAPEEYEEQRIVPTDGPVTTFKGRLLGEFKTEGRRMDRWSEGEVWETPAGAYVAVSIGASDVPGERDLVSVHVFPAGDASDGDRSAGDREFARRCAVMDAFRWHDRARDMAKKQLGWDLTTAVA